LKWEPEFEFIIYIVLSVTYLFNKDNCT